MCLGKMDSHPTSAMPTEKSGSYIFRNPLWIPEYPVSSIFFGFFRNGNGIDHLAFFSEILMETVPVMHFFCKLDDFKYSKQVFLWYVLFPLIEIFRKICEIKFSSEKRKQRRIR